MQEVVYPYEYMDNWEEFNGISLPEKKDFYNYLNMEDITDAGYAHAIIVGKDFEIRNLGDYHDIYSQSNTLLSVIIYYSASGLAWQAYVKKNKVKLDLLTDIDILLVVEKGIRGGICHLFHPYAEANNKNMKDYDKKELIYLKHLDVINLYGWAMSQKLSVKDFKYISQSCWRNFFNNFEKAIQIKVMKDIFSKLMFNFLKITLIYPFFLKEQKLNL